MISLFNHNQLISVIQIQQTKSTKCSFPLVLLVTPFLSGNRSAPSQYTVRIK